MQRNEENNAYDLSELKRIRLI